MKIKLRSDGYKGHNAGSVIDVDDRAEVKRLLESGEAEAVAEKRAVVAEKRPTPRKAEKR